MQKSITCPHCGKAILSSTEEAEYVVEEVQEEALSPVTTSSENIEEQIIATATKKVIAEVMKKIQPLLEKLAEAAQPQQQTKAPPLTTEEQLKSIQAAAQERMQQQEQRIAARMQKLRQRISDR